jgi:hypothetical protein
MANNHLAKYINMMVSVKLEADEQFIYKQTANAVNLF